MEDLALRVRLSVLWLIAELSMVVWMMLEIFRPGAIGEIIAGEIQGLKIGPELLLLFAIMFLVPLVMAFLSLSLKGSSIRGANIILGMIYTGLQLSGAIEHLTKLTVYSAYMILVEIMGSIFTALLAWYAYKWTTKS